MTHVFPGSNTPKGFYSFYKEGLKDMERVFVLKGGPGTGKSTLMRKIAHNMLERGYDVELWQCSSDNDSIDGVIIPDLAIAVVDGTAPHVVDPVYPGAVDEIVNLGNHWNQSLLREHKDEIKALTTEISQRFQTAYTYLNQAKVAYDAWCEITSTVTPEENEALLAQILDTVFAAVKPKVRHFFASAITPNGWVGYDQELSSRCAIRYLLKCKQMEQIHLALAKVAEVAITQGHDADLYHSAMEPDFLEMVVLPHLSIALIDSNAVGLEPNYGDVLIDMDGEDEKNPETVRYFEQWQMLLSEAKNQIAAAKGLHNQLESYYIQAMNFEEIDQVAKHVFAEIWSMAAEKEQQ